MNERSLRIALAIALSTVASTQGACSSSDPTGSAGGPAVASSGSSGSPSTASGGSVSGSSGAPDSGSGNNAARGGSAGSSATSGGGVALAGSGGTSPGAGTGNVGGSAGGEPATPSLAFGSDRVVVTGVRGTASPAAAASLQLHNSGQTAVAISNLALSGTHQALFHIASPASFPVSLAPGADVAIMIEMSTSGSAIPAAPANKDQGSVLLTSTLTATTSSGEVRASIYGLVLTQANYEPTLGQVLTTLGYQLNVGKAQNNWNPNTSMEATSLPGIETGTDEVAAAHFVKAGAGDVTMELVARFSPIGELPYGWYLTTSGCPAGCTTVGTMSKIPDVQTSDKARMVYPPLKASSMTTFDPGSAPFGIWIYSDQKTQKFMEGGNMVNGDWNYSQDALNSPANVHRFKTYPLKDSGGTAVPNHYLVAVEEAGNGDYQDYVFVLGNVTAMP